MADKKDKEFSYGSSFLPKGEKKYSVIRWGWNGLNREEQIDTGQLTDMSGMLCVPPYMETNKQPKVWIDLENGIPVNSGKVSSATRVAGKPISIDGFDNQLVLVWEYTDETVTPTVYRPMVSRFMQIHDDIQINQSNLADSSSPVSKQARSIVQYNAVNTSSGNIVNYSYDKKLLIYPDCYSVQYTFNKNPASWFVASYAFNTELNPIPVSDKAAVYQSRVFGTNNNAVYASDYNSYAAYNLDTVDDVSSAHAWWSMTNTNTEADSDVTAMCTYDNHVVIFKKDFMQLVYNNKNPFRIVDVGAFGCVGNKAWTIMNGVLFFASQDGIYAFTGGTPKQISQKLEVDDFSFAVLGSYKDTLYVANKDHLYTYKDGVWSLSADTAMYTSAYIIRDFATLDFGIVALAEYLTSSSETNYYKLLLLDWDTDLLADTPYDNEEWEPEYDGEWYFETDLMALGRLDVRRIKKVSVLCDGHPESEVNVYLMKPNETRPNVSSLVGTVQFNPAYRWKELAVDTTVNTISGTVGDTITIGASPGGRYVCSGAIPVSRGEAYKITIGQSDSDTYPYYILFTNANNVILWTGAPYQVINRERTYQVTVPTEAAKMYVMAYRLTGQDTAVLNVYKGFPTETGAERGFKMLRVLTRQFSSTMHRLYFRGRGYMKIHAAELKLSWGGDLYAEGK